MSKTKMAGCNDVYFLKLLFASLFIATVFVKSIDGKKMKLTGKISISGEGVSLGDESHLTVKLEDTSRMDASPLLLAEQEQTLPAGTKLGSGSDGLNYTIVCEKPEKFAPTYSVSAVLNVGWKASGEEWIRKGDYLTDTMHEVDLSQETEPIVVDIIIVHYPK